MISRKPPPTKLVDLEKSVSAKNELSVLLKCNDVCETPTKTPILVLGGLRLLLNSTSFPIHS